MSTIGTSKDKGLIFKIAIAWLSILMLAGFLIAANSAADEVTLSVIPEVPKTGEPVVATFVIGNPTDEPVATSYRLYIDGQLVESGHTTVAPQDSSKYQYAYKNLLERGQQINFLLRTSSDGGSYEKAVSLPAYPSQIMSSFVSFAAFSTSVMNSMISMEYFSDNFGTGSSLNTGIVITVVLIGLLIFLELTQAIKTDKGSLVISSYRARFAILSTFLFIIFIGMVFTRVVMILVSPG